MTLKGGEDGSVERLEELRNHVATKIGPIAKPANIVFTPELPTLADPTVVAEIADRAVAQPTED